MRIRLLLLLTALVIGPAATAGADDVSIADLVADSAAYDSAIVGDVTIEGELIGDFQRRGEYVWVQINGDAYAQRALLDGGDRAGGNIGIGARIPVGLFDGLGVQTPGGYRVRGPVVSLTGRWHHHDESRGGESWFETADAVVIAPEHHLDEPIDWTVMSIGLLLLAISAGVTVVTRRRPDGAD